MAQRCVASGSGNINTIATLAAGGTATYTVNATITANATASVVNTASVALPFAFRPTRHRQTTRPVTRFPIRPRVSKAFGVADFGAAGNTSTDDHASATERRFDHDHFGVYRRAAGIARVR